MIGQTLGHYRIVEKLGQGGMGVVYLAEDMQLGRRVALKLLPEEFAGQRERLERFLSEARLASSINHPNIVSIYELGEQEGRPFIAMEYVPGQSLRAGLLRGRLPLKKVLELAIPAAEALARAHRAGVVHRDIKPENLLVSEDGYIKVADFGLAKLKPSYSGETATLTGQFSTDAGKVVGTAAYMSPEQLQGEAVDGRSDVFSFGIVLYEMTTGRSPFLRGSAASTSAAILRDAPEPLRKLEPASPAELDRLISKALEKEPGFRYQTMEELATDLKRLRRDLEGGRLLETQPAAAALKAGAGWRMGVAIGAAAVLVVAGVWIASRWREQTPAAPPMRVVQLTSLPGLEDEPTWSPDGRSIAYTGDAAGNLDIYVQQIGGGRAIRITDSDADDAQPAWSPDGTLIAFVSARARPEKRLSAMLNLAAWSLFYAGRNGDLWVMPALGGTARRIAEDGYFPAWSPDGRRLVYQCLRKEYWDLCVQEVEGGEARALGLDLLNLPVVTQPAWSPDGKWIAFVAGTPASLQLRVVPAEGGASRLLTEADKVALRPAWSPDGRWLYFSSDRGGQMNIWRARFDNGQIDEPMRITTGAGPDLHVRVDASGRRLAYSSVQGQADLWEHNLKTGRESPVMTETAFEDHGNLSPDGRWLAFGSTRSEGIQIWLRSIDTGNLTQVTPTPYARQALGASWWSSDSKYLYFGGAEGIEQYDVAVGSARRIYTLPPEERGTGGSQFCLSPDGRYLVLGGGDFGIVRIELATAKRVTLAKPADGVASEPLCSPDGQWVTFQVQRGPLRKVWVVPMAGGAAQQVTFGESEDSHPSWSADSQLIYFDRNHQDVYVVPRAGGEPKPVTHYRSFTVTLDYPMATRDGRIIYTRNDKVGDIFVLETTGE
ncbi:MAG TPA: LpqB family beta-propeller domain-containing protein [Candidatus Xenobia bacterium]|nr:LpqB family beta-propeller domain-containing protein [Candidatus Xenobia bacterium]